MSDTSKLDEIRRAAFESVEESTRASNRHAMWLGHLMWVVVGVYLYAAYYGYSPWFLILLAGLFLYCWFRPIVSDLRAHIDICTQRVLRAIDTIAPDKDDKE
jgi:predicted PurR-regulated permease PerM